MSKSSGGKRSGIAAVKNKTGIHAFSSEKKKRTLVKARKAFLDKWKNPEYRKLHANKVRLGKLISRLEKAFRKTPSPENAFGYDWH